MSGWDDAEILCALARGDEVALRVLHERYAPHLFALARRARLPDASTRVEEAFLAVVRSAHCHARTSVDARTWILVTAGRAMLRSVGR